MPRTVRRFWHSKDRGLRRYGTPVVCTYGTTARIYDSSSASGPHVWLGLEQNPLVLSPERSKVGEAVMHLNRRQAQALVDRLSAWLEANR